MNERALRLLQIDPDQARRTADFFESYANTVSRGLYGPPQGDGPDTGASVSDVPGWEVRVDTSTSLRLAGQWAMLFDTERARRLLSAAGGILHDLGHGFGTYLLVAYAAEPPNLSQVASRIEMMTGRHRPDGEVRGDGPLPEPLSHPQQQAYLLVAAAGMVRNSEAGHAAPGKTDVELDEYAARYVRIERHLQLLLSRSPHRRGVATVGALGTPIRVYWDIASRLLRSGPGATDSVIGHLRTMAQRYSTAVDLAMANKRLWFNGAAPVDVCDVDITALALIAARALGVDHFRSALRSALAETTGLESVPLGIADAMLPDTDRG
ncbi:hypothetical protein [Streptomyces sp. JNUCC 63]